MPPTGRLLSLPVLAAGAAALACILGGSGFVFMRLLVGETEPVTVALLRNGLGAAIILVVTLVFARARIPWRDLLAVVAIGIALLGVFHWLATIALQFTTSGRAAIVTTSMPFMTLAVGAALGLERPTAQKIGGLALAAAGVTWALWDDAGGHPGAWRGDLLMLLAALIGATASVFAARYVRRYPPMLVVAAGLTPAALMLALGALATGAPLVPAQLSPEGWAAVVWLGTASSAGSYFLWYWALRHTTPTLVAVTVTLNPVTALTLGLLLLGEALTAGLVGGLVLVVAGIVVANRPSRLPAAQAAG
ncbi:MAG: DMT family transporter [Alphaproteobacteria bacterium]|nr:DMT family transporter [Alphaproteobacteria bacterium]